MSLSGIIHHSHSFTKLEIYHHIYFIYYHLLAKLVLVDYFMTFQGEDNEELTFVVIPNTVAEVTVIF